MLLEKVIICNFHKIIFEISLALSKSIAGLMKRKNDFRGGGGGYQHKKI